MPLGWLIALSVIGVLAGWAYTVRTGSWTPIFLDFGVIAICLTYGFAAPFRPAVYIGVVWFVSFFLPPVIGWVLVNYSAAAQDELMGN